MKNANLLIHETSPYLLQHAYNPVNWQPWTEDAFSQAKAENKPVIISIGYSACHWCHVMERETFESEEAAALMNEFFICVKVDREERPDIDQIYLDAVQIITGQGGWPLNVICLPDKRPIFGGTYFRVDQWMDICDQIAGLWKTKPTEIYQYASDLEKGILKLNQIITNEEVNTSIATPHILFETLEKSIDPHLGGLKGSPKFPMPGILSFLANYGALHPHTKAIALLETTLQKMAHGGIYDQLGGGFSRYSVDGMWKVPHFEKMLYDNAQLIGVYSKAYRITKNPLYKKVVFETIGFCKRELAGENGGYQCALDADSEGVEGLYYCWKKDEIRSLLNDFEYPVFKSYYGIDTLGKWEHDLNILLVANPVAAVASELNISDKEVLHHLTTAKEKLFEARQLKIYPGIDTKILCSWNALLLSGLCEAYKAFPVIYIEETARDLFAFLQKEMMKDHTLFRSPVSEKRVLDAFSEDYALTIEAFLSYYATFMDICAFNCAIGLFETMENEFFDTERSLYAFTSLKKEPLIIHKFDISDNVMPSSNSVMALNAFTLYLLTGDGKYKIKADLMLDICLGHTLKFPAYYYNWAKLATYRFHKHAEISFTGEKAYEIQKFFNLDYHPNCLSIAATETENACPALAHKDFTKEVNIYVCSGEACLAPTEKYGEAVKLIATLMQE